MLSILHAILRAGRSSSAPAVIQVRPVGIAAHCWVLLPFVQIYESEALKHHAISVLSTVGAAVAGLGDLQKLVPILEDLGKRHVNYGVKAEHYNIIGEALIDTLALSLGPAFTPEVKCEWMKVYSMVANTMKGDNYKVESLHGSADDWYMATDPRLRCAPPSSVERLHAVAKSKAAADDWYMGSSLTTATSRHNP
eukprot:scaffold115767_cov35-Tisochrysis_lutea.AAC.3